MLNRFKNHFWVFSIFFGLISGTLLEAKATLFPYISNELIAQNSNQFGAEKSRTENQETLKEVQATYEKLRFHFNQNNIDSVESYLKWLQSWQRTNEYFKIYYLLGKECYESLKENHQAAIETSFQSLALAEEYQLDELVPEILNSLGANFLLIEELESAQQYFTLALRKGDLVSDQIKISIFNNLGIIYKKREIIDSALYYYNEAYDLIQIEGNPILLAQNLNNRGNLLKNTGRFKEALFLYQECERVSKRNDLDFGVFVSLVNTSDMYLKLGDPDLAITNIESAEEMAESIDISGYKKEIAVIKYEAYKQKKDYKKALDYYVEFKDIEDSLKSNQLVLDLERLKTEYAEQALEIKVAKLEKEQLKLRYLSWIIGFGLLFFFVSWHYTRYRLKSKEIEANHLREIENTRETLLNNKEEQLRHKTALILSFKNRLRKIDEKVGRRLKLHKIDSSVNKEIKRIISSQNTSEYENQIEIDLKNYNEDLFAVLLRKFPDLTRNELDVCAFIRMGYTSKDIASATNRSVRTIELIRLAIRKKMGLSPNDPLNTYILKILDQVETK